MTQELLDKKLAVVEQLRERNEVLSKRLNRNWGMLFIVSVLGLYYLNDPDYATKANTELILSPIGSVFPFYLKFMVPFHLIYVFANVGYLTFKYLAIRALLELRIKQTLGEEEAFGKSLFEVTDGDFIFDVPFRIARADLIASAWIPFVVAQLIIASVIGLSHAVIVLYFMQPDNVIEIVPNRVALFGCAVVLVALYAQMYLAIWNRPGGETNMKWHVFGYCAFLPLPCFMAILFLLRFGFAASGW